MKYLIALVTALLALTACSDKERLDKLEKQNQELQAQILKARSSVADYDLQAKCSKDARAWFQSNWAFGGDKDTIILDHTNHYNRAQNKCFAIVEYHFNTGVRASWANYMGLWDIYENSKYGEFREAHNNTMVDGKFQAQDRVDECYVAGQTCKSVNEFNNLTRSFMSN
jgi:hypothetical protein